MNARTLSLIGLLGCVGAAMLPAVKSGEAISPKITGDYVEARTAAVFGGACHYNGEYVTTGRDAVMAWNFTGGSFDGVDLTGVRAAAAITSDANLGEVEAQRKSEIVIDSAATAKQAAAAAALIQSKSAKELGQVVSVRRAPITFVKSEYGFEVAAEGFASMTVQPMPDNTCCTSPGLVWFSPLTPIDGRRVGYTEIASYSGDIATPWQRFGENDAFYGTFAY